MITRNDTGQATVRAVRLEGELTLDGALDERIYQTVPSISGFIQVEPDAGQPASERTEAWVFFEEDNVYVAARLWDSAPESRWVVNEMRRDSFNILQNENVSFAFDTFYDRRNVVIFNITPIGGRMDGQGTNERNWNGDWNPIWDVRTGRFDGGWSFEARIPFKSLQYRPGRLQVWGFQMRRQVRWKNETSYLTRLDRALAQMGVFQASQAASLVGLEAPRSGRPFEIKPYAIGDIASDRTAVPNVTNEPGGNVGIDLIKYGVTQNLTADFTVNTDFAQVEADEQQVNLTRFSLFFPEKREFFLANQGTFAFGTGGGFGPGGGSPDAPILFYSRQIGLNAGREVPIRARRAAHGSSRRVHARRAEHPDRRRADDRSAEHRFLRRPDQARCAAAQQRRRDLHAPLGVGLVAGRIEPGLRSRRHVCVLRQSLDQRLLGQDRDHRRRP